MKSQSFSVLAYCLKPHSLFLLAIPDLIHLIFIFKDSYVQRPKILTAFLCFYLELAIHDIKAMKKNVLQYCSMTWMILRHGLAAPIAQQNYGLWCRIYARK